MTDPRRRCRLPNPTSGVLWPSKDIYCSIYRYSRQPPLQVWDGPGRGPGTEVWPSFRTDKQACRPGVGSIWDRSMRVYGKWDTVSCTDLRASGVGGYFLFWNFRWKGLVSASGSEGRALLRPNATRLGAVKEGLILRKEAGRPWGLQGWAGVGWLGAASGASQASEASGAIGRSKSVSVSRAPSFRSGQRAAHRGAIWQQSPRGQHGAPDGFDQI